MDASTPIKPSGVNGRNCEPACASEPPIYVDPNEPRNNDVDLKRIEAAVRVILDAVGEDPDREGLLETPARVARMYQEMFAGLKSDPGRHLSKVFVEEYDEIVIVRDISFHWKGSHRVPTRWKSGRTEQAGAGGR